ncbi:MAG: FecR domain-containing protein [Spirochaetia bacterium]|nr:FecR domain-containing protein [Spirochaetia bacterium]
MGEQEKRELLPPGFLPYQRMLEAATPERELPAFDAAWLQKEPAHVVPTNVIFPAHGASPLKYAAMAAIALFTVGLSALFVVNRAAVIAFIENKGSSEGVQGSGVLRAAVVFVQGQPQLDHEGKTGGMELGQMLVQGDRIITGPGARVDLGLPGGHIVRIKEQSDVEISTLRQTKSAAREAVIGLKNGEVVASVRKLDNAEKMQIKAPTAIAGVRGTGFRVSTDGARSIVVVADGAVEVQTAAAAAKVLEAGQSVTATKEETKEEAKLDAGSAAALKGELTEMEANRAAMDSEVMNAAAQLPIVKSDADIARVYNRVEVVRLKNGTQYRGVVASQVGTVLLVQTSQGTFIVDSSQVSEIINEK